MAMYDTMQYINRDVTIVMGQAAHGICLLTQVHLQTFYVNGARHMIHLPGGASGQASDIPIPC